jgi:hypothetical protein
MVCLSAARLMVTVRVNAAMAQVSTPLTIHGLGGGGGGVGALPLLQDNKINTKTKFIIVMLIGLKYFILYNFCSINTRDFE